VLADTAPPTEKEPAVDRTESEFQLKIVQVVPLSSYRGKMAVADVDPRFVLVGEVTWVQPPEVMALHSRHAFAIHSPARLGIGSWEGGATICLIMIRTRDTVRLRTTKPDLGCGGRGGG
jgi:hypothetical protein